MRRAAKVDGNQAEFVAFFRGCGMTVQHLHTVGRGVPDLLLGFRGVNELVEMKMPGGKLTADEVSWHARWAGTVEVVRTIDDAKRVRQRMINRANARFDATMKRLSGLPELPTSVLACAAAPERSGK